MSARALIRLCIILFSVDRAAIIVIDHFRYSRVGLETVISNFPVYTSSVLSSLSLHNIDRQIFAVSFPGLIANAAPILSGYNSIIKISLFKFDPCIFNGPLCPLFVPRV